MKNVIKILRNRFEEIAAKRFRKRVKKAVARVGFSCVGSLGSGSFGDVYLVEDENGKQSALKIVKPKLVCYGELYMWKELRHRNVLPLNNITDLPDIPAYSFIMPVVEMSYFKMIESPFFFESPRALAWNVTIFKGIIKGMEYLHENGYAHMDLKTNNILISKNKTAKICDFTFLTKPNYFVKK